MVRANANGSIIRLRDVARVSLKHLHIAQRVASTVRMLPFSVSICFLGQCNGSAKSVSAMEEISANFPEGMSYEIPFDMTTYISESIHEVYKTLFGSADSGGAGCISYPCKVGVRR